MFSKLIASVLLLAVVLPSVHGHGAITAVTGANGVTAMGFGVDASTPRDGTRRTPFQTDSSIIRDREIESGKADACGRTLAGGINNVATMLAAADSAGLPTAGSDGSVTMTLHQVNGDGAGPYTCEVSADGTGQAFVNMAITQQVPGKNSRSNAKAQDFALVAQMPAGTTCTGGPSGAACLVRCRNAARAGPFGGCVAVTNGDAAAPAAAAPATAAPAAAAPAAASASSANSTSVTTAPATVKATAPAAAAVTPAAAAVQKAPRELSDEEVAQAEAEEAEQDEDFDELLRVTTAAAMKKAARELSDDEVAEAEAEEAERDGDFEQLEALTQAAASKKMQSRQESKRWIRSRIVGQRRAWQWI